MSDNEIAIITEKKPYKRTGRGGKENFPNARKQPQTPADKAIVSKMLNEILVEYRQPKVTSDEELMQRFDEYFERCINEGRVPVIEEMYLSTGIPSSTLYDWETKRTRGLGNFTSEIIKKAKEIIKTFDAKLVIKGEMNFLAYCFRAKNYYGMVDKQEYVVTPNAQITEETVDNLINTANQLPE